MATIRGKEKKKEMLGGSFRLGHEFDGTLLGGRGCFGRFVGHMRVHVRSNG